MFGPLFPPASLLARGLIAYPAAFQAVTFIKNLLIFQ
jgi:hypothetical protein